MEKKLFKEVDFYGLEIDDKIVGLNNDSTNKLLNYPFKLSLKNCQAIEDGYDLDELAKNIKTEDGFEHKQSFIEGAKTILEILGDKKFSEEDVRKAFVDAFQKCYEVINSGKFDDITSAIEWLTQTNADNYIQSLKQTEWDVEICCYVEENNGWIDADTFNSPMLIGTGEPKLDADGCLILKRI